MGTLAGPRTRTQTHVGGKVKQPLPSYAHCSVTTIQFIHRAHSACNTRRRPKMVNSITNTIHLP
uniref:Uncharacterized protein n=1 Tax=Arundo donax TaxID=35708 RepID=A0A0A9C458_ARUDO